MKRQRLPRLVALFLLLIFFSCQKGNPSIDGHIDELGYDMGLILNALPLEEMDTERKQTGTNTKSNKKSGKEITCVTKMYNLKKNFEDVAILRPTSGIIWPGALVKVNKALLDGLPEPITLTPASVSLRLDLPGIGKKGTIDVDEPSHGTVQTGIDEALDWWNDNAYQDGYVNASNSSYKVATSYSSQQLAMDLGLNVAWAKGDVATHFSYNKDTERSMAMMVFKQVFYTITAEAPKRPSNMFDSAVTVEELSKSMDSISPPGYVQSVSYGRIIMFKMEAAKEQTDAEMEGAFNYATGVSQVSGDLEAKYKSILASSSMSVITIGGNAEAAAEGVSAKNYGDLQKIIKGKNAVYSKENPGVPIAYTVRFLKDNSIAKMGFTTDYSRTTCTEKLIPGATVSVFNEAAYGAKLKVRYTDKSGKRKTKEKKYFLVGYTAKLSVPAGAYNIEVDVDYKNTPATWKDHFTKKFAYPRDACYRVWGTAFKPKSESIRCK